MPSSILYDYVVVAGKEAEAESYAYCLVFRHERATLLLLSNVRLLD